jgi:hypothetical protein
MKPLSNQQRLHQVNTEQLFENYRSAMHHAASYQYGMRWKTVRSKDYLFRENWGQIRKLGSDPNCFVVAGGARQSMDRFVPRDDINRES